MTLIHLNSGQLTPYSRAILTSSSFTLGTRVQIISTGQWGVVIKTPDKKNKVRVAVGALEILVDAENLKAKALSTKKQQSKTQPSPSRREAGPLAITIDLHGKTVAEAIEIVEAAIDRAVMQSTREIEIVHGLGTGKLKSAIHKYLGQHSDFVAFGPHVNNPGSTIARIKRNN